MQPNNNPYPDTVSYPSNATPRKEWTTWNKRKQICVGIFLGRFPLLLTLFFTMLTSFTFSTNLALSCNVFGQAAGYSFLGAAPLVLLIAVVCLFLKGRRWISFAAFLTWIPSIILAYLIVTILALSISDPCSAVVPR